jgi:hypothetical protein
MGCSHVPKKTDSVFSIKDYMPLAVGQQWTYATTFQSQPQDDVVVSIVGQQGPYFIDNLPKPSRFVVDAHGLRDGSKRYLLKNPLAVGTQWMSVADVKTVERYRIVAIDRKVSLPAGVFKNCVVVSWDVQMKPTEFLRNEMTFAPCVGIVEIKVSHLKGDKARIQSHFRLKSFIVKTSQKADECRSDRVTQHDPFP